MGFFDNVKKAFDTGGIDVDVDAPKTFRWSDGSIPLTVTIRGHESEERAITSIELELREDDRDPHDHADDRRKKNRGISQTIAEPRVIAAGETVTLELKLVLDAASAVEEASGEDAPAWLKAVGAATNVLSELNRETPWYQVKVTPEVEGAGAKKIATQRIKNLGVGEWSLN